MLHHVWLLHWHNEVSLYSAPAGLWAARIHPSREAALWQHIIPVGETNTFVPWNTFSSAMHG